MIGHHSLALDLVDLEILDALAPLLLVIMIAIALALGAVVVRIVSRSGGLSRVSADDPYFFPIGEAPVLPHQLITSAGPSRRGGRLAASPTWLECPDNSFPRSIGTAAANTTKGVRHG
jgi:hypothetical protein